MTFKRTGKSITFTVDGKLPQTRDSWPLYDANAIVREVLDANKRVVCDYLTSSFEGEKLWNYGKADCFFKTILIAFCEHKSLVFSPDMIWLKILQSFSRHVNDNPERYRHLTSVEPGKAQLILETTTDIFGDDADWAEIMNDFQQMIAKNVKGEFNQNLVADFTTTTPAEKIASQITIMDAMKPYFEFVVHRMICGIPSITLLGTSDDWRSVLTKAESLTIFDGLRDWITELTPILQQFIDASEGKVDTRFWKSIVMKRHPSELHLGGCVPERNPYLNGWILKFYPFDYGADSLRKFEPGMSMKSEVACVPWKYVVEGNGDTQVFPMEFWAGFVGADVSVHLTFEKGPG